jgi:hypothetical protein
MLSARKIVKSSNARPLAREAVRALRSRNAWNYGRPGRNQRGTVELAARQDDSVPDGVVFIPFAYVEAAANLLTNPALDPFGKIPEFKYCAARVDRIEARAAAE